MTIYQANVLPKGRILSIDTFRGITILVMIFVNEVAGVKGVPVWMKHMPANADAMTFVDAVFPAFLFIVGMSVPFALQNRLSKGDTFLQLQWHILFRTLGLLTLGVFMVNAEGDYNEAAMIMPISLWSLCFYAAAILVWNVYTFQNPVWKYVLRGIGLAGLVALALIYRGGDGTQSMQPHWWGILGLIGWAYLYTSIGYQLVRGQVVGLLGLIVLCTLIYGVSKSAMGEEMVWLQWTKKQAGNAAHTSIALCGVVVSLLFFDQKRGTTVGRRFTEVALFALVLLIAAFVLRPYYQVSKIYATPSWCFYSAASSCIIFSLLYWLIDLQKHKSWTGFFQPAASNPLLTYIIPSILLALFTYFDFYPVPAAWRIGIGGILWSALYAVLIMGFVQVLNRLRIRLQL